ncbi:hypothetical protein SLEP1_g9606 [Rubroshorea leprosula]|uniref:PX domain-containing protein n=1 Tax=Rubroshorea leprosula TaxID=152421 RepID=A0AAV5IBD7_9ROSI|nr:hypothetical protein SLEP1_g9606 [Rubroshorea leprosula]
MDTLVLDDPSDHGGSINRNSYSNYCSATSPLSDTTHHPLLPPIVVTPADSDPPLAPPPYCSTSANDSNSYIEPPSYADVIFSPFDESSVSEINGVETNSQNFDSSLMFSRSPSSSSDYIKITVSNPQKEYDSTNSLVPGSNTFTTYLITTRTNISDYGGSEFSVRRRFRDVVTLADRLAEAYRGFFIPPRPDKNVVKSQVQGKMPLPTSTDVASRMLDGTVKLPKQLLGESNVVVAPQEVGGIC